MQRLSFGSSLLALCLLCVGCVPDRNGKNNDSDTAPQQQLTPANARLQSLEKFHDHCTEQFVLSEGFGDGRFLALRAAPSFPKSVIVPAIVTGEPDATWMVKKIELVSLLKQQTPGVYPAEKRTGLMRGIPATRPLDAFENEALKSLQAGETLVSKAEPEQIRMLGALRMQESCKKCHDYPEGKLLGAFTYSLKVPSAMPKTEAAPAAEQK